MKKIVLLSIMLALLGLRSTFAQTPFQRVYSSISAFNSIQQTTDGGYIIAGYDTSHACLLKLDASMNVMWNKTFRGNDHRQFNSVYQTSDGGYIAAGSVNFQPNNTSKIFLARTDVNGDTLWSECIGGTSDIAYSVRQTPDGGFIVAGQTNSSGSGYLDACLIKIDANGVISWTKDYNSNNFGIFNEIQNTSDGGFIMTGGGESMFNYYEDIFLVKTNSTGDTAWTKNIDEGWNIDDAPSGKSVIQTSDGGYMVLGNDDNSLNFQGQAVMIKLNSSGDTTWTKTLLFSDYFSPDITTYINSIKQTPDGGYIIAGSSSYGNSPMYNGNYAVLIKTDMNGDTLWTKKYGEASQYNGSDAYINDVQLTNDGGFILAGYSDSPVYGALLIKTDDLGNTTCDAGYAVFDYTKSRLSICQGAILASGGIASGIYTVAGILDTTYINPCLQVPAICMVTVDSATQKNMVIWEKNFDTSNVASYNIYKETTTSGVYAKIGNVPQNVLSTFTDYASNPPQKAARYEITTVDSHGIEAYTKSYPHKTIHLAINLGNPPQINLMWDGYEGFTVNTYRIWRGNAGGVSLIDSVQGTISSYTDLNPPANDTLYFIEALHTPCNPTAKGYTSTKSNFAIVKTPGGINEINKNTAFSIYPNPSNDHIMINFPAYSAKNKTTLELFNINGELLNSLLIRGSKTQVNIAELPAGVYTIKIMDNSGVAVKKVIKE